MNYPPERIKLRTTRDKILWMLSNNSFCQWKDLVEDPIRIPRASLSKYVNRLRDKSLIEKVLGERYNVYRITPLGQIEYGEMLDDYDFDPQFLLEEKIKRFRSISDISLKFFQKVGLEKDSIKIRFNKYLKIIDYLGKRFLFRNMDHFLYTTLFLSKNHPEEAPSFVSIKEFSEQYGIPDSSLIHYIETLLEDNPYLTKFFEIHIEGDNSYYLPENDTLEILLKKIIEDFVEKKFHSLILNNPADEFDYQLKKEDIKELSQFLCEKYRLFPSELEYRLYDFLPGYISHLSYEMKSEPFIFDDRDISRKITRSIIQGFADSYTQFDSDLIIRHLAFNQNHLDRVTKLFEEATNYMKAKNYNKASKIIDEAIALNSEIPILYYIKAALFLIFLHDLDRANESIDQSIRLLRNHIMDVYDMQLYNIEHKKYMDLKDEILLRKKMKIAIDALFDVFRDYNCQSIKVDKLSKLIQIKTDLDPGIIRDTLTELYKNQDYFKFEQGNIELITPIEKTPEDLEIQRPKIDFVDLFNSFKLIIPKSRRTEDFFGYSLKILSSQFDDYRLVNFLNKNIINETNEIKIVRNLINEEKYEEALTEINNLLIEDKENKNYLQIKAFILNELEENEEALEVINRVLLYNKKNELSYLIKTKIMMNLKNYDEALAVIKLGLSLNPVNMYFLLKNLFVAIIIKDKKRISESFEKINQQNHEIHSLYYLQAIDYFEFAKFKESLKLIEKAILFDNENISYYLLKAEILREMGRFEESLDNVNRVIDLNPKDSHNYEFKSVLLDEMGKYKRALNQIDNAIHLDPNQVSYYILKSIILMSLERGNDALDVIDYAIEIDPENWKSFSSKMIILLELGDSEAWIQTFKKFDELSGPKDNILLYHCTKALFLSLNNEFDRAIKEIEKAEAIQPNEYGIFFVKMRILIRKGDFEKALVVINNAIDHYPNYSDFYLNKTNILRRQNKLNLALESIEKAIALNPTYNDYYLIKAEILTDLEDYDNAIECVNNLLEVEPNNPSHWHNKAKILKLKNEYKSSIDSINNAIELRPNSADYYNFKAEVLMHLTEYKESLKTIEKAIDLEPNSSSHWHIKAWILQNSKQYEEAIAAINKAIELEPKWWGHYSQKSDIYFIQDRHEESLIAIEKAIEFNPENDELYLMEAKNLDILKRYKEALYAVDTAIELNSKDIEYYELKIDILKVLDQIDLAYKVADDLFKLYPEEPYVYFIKGSLLFTEERYVELEKLYDKGIKKFPQKSSLYSGKAEALELMGENNSAIEIYKKAFKLEPNPFYLRMIAEILYKLEKYEEAFSFLDKYILELEDSKEKAKLYACKSSLLTKLKKYEDALVSINQGIKLSVDNRNMQEIKAYILYKKEEYEQVIDICQDIIELDSFYSRAYYIQGKSYYKIAKFSIAIEKLKKAIQYASYKESKYYYYLALCYKALGENQLANETYKQLEAIEKEKDDRKWLTKLKVHFSDIE